MREQPGYYPGFETLTQQRFWDAKTRNVVLKRVEEPPPLEFFSADEERFWTCVFAHLIPQDDRLASRRIPIINAIDHRLTMDQTIGYRYADMPPDRDAYRLGGEAIDAEARVRFALPFLELDFTRQDMVLKYIHDGKPGASANIWEKMSVHRFWQLIICDAAEAYYSHPWAWDEIGFGGPSYPRGYMRLEHGAPEPWEVAEQRYEWATPSAAVSGETEDTQEFHYESVQHSSHSETSTS